jgi:hypothetical protein
VSGFEEVAELSQDALALGRPAARGDSCDPGAPPGGRS